jgi:hypothetical protein
MKFGPAKLLVCWIALWFPEGDGRGYGVGADAGALQGGSRVEFASEDSAKLTAAHRDALAASGTAAEGFSKGGAEQLNFASGSNLVKSRTGTIDRGGSAGSFKGRAEEAIAPCGIGDGFVNPARDHGAAAPIPNGSGKVTAAKPLESSGGVDVFDATVGAKEHNAKLTAAHDALDALGTAAEGLLKDVAEESNFASGSNLVESRAGTANGGGSAGSLKGGAEGLIAPRGIAGDRFVDPVAAHGAAVPIPNGAKEATAANPLEISRGVDVFDDATGGAASDDVSTQLVSKKRKGRKLMRTDGCKDDPNFEFFRKKKSGRIVSKGGCKHVGRKKKRRCRKVIDGVRVRKSCPRTCSRCTPPRLFVGVGTPFNSRISSAFNSGVFDRSKEDFDERQAIADLSQKCENFFNRTDASTPTGEVFGCKLWFQFTDVYHPFALGPVKPGTDLLNSYSPPGYKFSSDYQMYTDIFTSNALAVMISEGCFEFLRSDFQDKDSYHYATQSELRQSWRTSQSTSIDVNAGVGPFSVNMASERSRTETSEFGRTERYFHAKRKFFSKIGTVQNICFNDCESGNHGGECYNLKSVKKIVDNNLVRSEWKERWLAIRPIFGYGSATLTKEFLETNIFTNKNFTKVAEAGVLIPNIYEYGVEVNFYVTGSFVQTSSSQTKKISNSISSGMSGAYEEFTAGTSLSDKVERSINNMVGSATSYIHVQVQKRGEGVTTDCLNQATCEVKVEAAAQLVRDDIGLLGVPMRPQSYLSMDAFLQNYFDAVNFIEDDPDHFRRKGGGLPLGFKEALTVYYSYEKCAPNDNRSCGCPAWKAQSADADWNNRARLCAKPQFAPNCCKLNDWSRWNFIGTFNGDGVFDNRSMKYCIGTCRARKRFLYIEDDPSLCNGRFEPTPSGSYGQDSADFWLNYVVYC